MITISEILKGSDYSLSQFGKEKIIQLESLIEEKDVKGKPTPYINCRVRNKSIKLTPEEIVRQLYLMVLIDDFHYPVSRMELEYVVTFGREKKRADIVIFDKDQTYSPYIIVELKSPKLKDGKEQLKSYCNGTGAPIGIWTNGESISYYHRKDPNFFEDIPTIPNANEKLSDILSERWTIDDLIAKDKLVNERKSLKDLILEMEDEVLANAGVDVFEEVFKLIFTKLYDEMESGRKKDRHLEFRNYGDTETELKEKLQNLFNEAKEKWAGVFTEDAKLMLTPSHLSVCVSSLQDVKLFNSNLDVVDEAFEYLINKSSKGEKGQYFTPRYVIDMCVRMLNPSAHETMIDTAAGSCGFPVHTIFYVWQKILESKGLKKSHLFTLEQKPQECSDYVQSKVFAIDFDEKAVRVARTLNLIAGDGQTNVLHLNTLDYERWDENLKDENWQETYFNGWNKLKKMRLNKSSNRDFQFDILMANPPFAGDIKESRILSKYELSKNAAGKMASKVGRDILFIERNLDFLKPGGRMAIVLPQGRFNNSSDKYIRDYIAERCRILAVVGLHGNVFKPHTGTKTSVLFVQKWDDVLCPKKEDYPIFFATMQEPSKDNSGEKIFVKKGDYPRSAKPTDGQNEWMVSDVVAHYEVTPKENNEYLLDSHGHLIVKHDLFNHDGLTRDGIAEAFAEFAKKEGLSFFLGSPFNEAKYKQLLEGLEIREDMFSKTIENKDFRIDSQYYTQAPIKNPILKYKKIGDVIHSSQYGISIEMNENGHGYPIYRMNELHNMLCDIEVNKYADITQDECRRFALRNRDVLFNRTNSFEWVGRTGVYYQNDNIERTFASYLVRFNPIESVILPEYLCAFFNTKQGIRDIKRRARQSINQTNVNPEEVKEIEIPILDMDFQLKIQEYFERANSCRLKSLSLYKDAEIQLISELGLKDWQPNNAPVNIKQLKESFLANGRLDAEYYQTKYEDYAGFIRKYKNGFDILGNVCSLNEKNFNPLDNTEYRYIELSNIGNSGEITGYTTSIGAELPSRARRLVHTNDVIVSSIEGSLQSVALVTAEYDKAICSTGFYVVKSETINPETLLVLFKSEPMQNLLKQGCSGTILTAIGRNELQNIVMPKIRNEVQTEIAEYVQKSIALRNEAKQLLENAKLQVEDAIFTPPHLTENQLVIKYNQMIEESTYYYRLAEWTLLQELYAEKWTTNTTANYSIKNYSVCKTTGRLDAEYYQPKYDDLFFRLSQFECDTIKDIANIKKSVEPGSEAYQESGIPFVRVSDVTKFGISEPNVFLSPKDFDLAELQPKKDTILLSKDGSVGIAYKVEEDTDCITSGALLHLSVFNKEYNPDYLTLVLNSKVVQMQAERDSNGAIIQHWKPSEIEQVIIPKLPKPIQETISARIQESFALKAESKRLLDEAKMMVEREIEKE